MVQKLVMVALVGACLAIAACNTVRGAASDMGCSLATTEEISLKGSGAGAAGLRGASVFTAAGGGVGAFITGAGTGAGAGAGFFATGAGAGAGAGARGAGFAASRVAGCE